MIVSHLIPIPLPDLLPAEKSRLETADKSGNLLPADSHVTTVDISKLAHQSLEQERQNLAQAQSSQAFVDFRGHEGGIRLGLWALGRSALDDWSAKGLEITEASILYAAEQFQKAFRQNLEESGASMAGTAIALNRHQIVMNSQAVPDWFIEEYTGSLASMGNSAMREAFEQGDTFLISRPTALGSLAIDRYLEVERSL